MFLSLLLFNVVEVNRGADVACMLRRYVSFLSCRARHLARPPGPEPGGSRCQDSNVGSWLNKTTPLVVKRRDLPSTCSLSTRTNHQGSSGLGLFAVCCVAQSASVPVQAISSDHKSTSCAAGFRPRCFSCILSASHACSCGDPVIEVARDQFRPLRLALALPLTCT